MVTKPLHPPKAYGCVNKLFKRPGEINTLFGRTTLTAYQCQEEVWLRRRKRLTGARLLPSVDDFAMFADGFDATMLLKDKTFSRVLPMGLYIYETKRHHVATQVGDNMCMTLDF